MSQESSPNKIRLLLLGAALGAAMAATGILAPTEPEDPGVLASIDGERLLKSDYLAFLNQMSEERREPLSTGDRRRILDRLIEEKLLINRGMELGLPWEDSAVRKAIARAMIDTVVLEAEANVPTDTELETFYTDNLAYFRPEPRLRVQRLQFRGDAALQRAQTALNSLDAGDNWQEIEQQLADAPLPPVPSNLLPSSRLVGYLGDKQLEVLLGMKPGEHSEPIEGTGSVSILRLLGREESPDLPLEKIRERVVAEYQRRASDEALRDYLDELRASAHIVIDQEFLQQLDSVASPDD